MSKTKIEWCDWTWNPVWGCLNNCPYCYARKTAKRFGWNIADKENYHYDFKFTDSQFELLWDNLKNFKPTWIESNFQKTFPRKPSRIFVNSMSGIEYWKPEWMQRVLDKIKEYPQHKFLFLTKDFDVYADYDFPENCWLGYTIVYQKQMDALCYDDAFYPPDTNNKFFISIEPIQEYIDLTIYPDWLIIGCETGNQKNKIIPKSQWIDLIYCEAADSGVLVFMKDNLKSVWGENLIQEFPE